MQLFVRYFLPLHAAALVFLVPLLLGPAAGIEPMVCAASYGNGPLTLWGLAAVAHLDRSADSPWLVFPLVAACYAGTAALAAVVTRMRTGGRPWLRAGALARVVLVSLLLVGMMILVRLLLVGILKSAAFFAVWGFLAWTAFEWFFFARHWLLLPVLAIEGLPLSEARERTRTLSRTHFGSRLMQIGGLVLFEWLAFWLLADLLFVRLRANGELIALLPAFLASTLHAAAWASAYARVTRHEPHDTAELERIFR